MPVQAIVPRRMELASHWNPASARASLAGSILASGMVGKQEVLHIGGAQLAVAVLFGDTGGVAHLLVGEASGEHAAADPVQAFLLLRVHAEMVAGRCPAADATP